MRRNVLTTTALFLAVLGVTTCGGEADGAARTTGHARHAERGGHTAHAESGLEAGAATDMSLHHLEGRWTDQAGNDLTLAGTGGAVRVIAMAYTHCAYACPRIVLDMQRIESQLPSVEFVLASIDPQRDTPERLREYADRAALDDQRWTLLTAEEGDVLELAAALGVRYRRTSESDFVHSNILTVLDENGVIIHRQQGIGAPDEIVAAIRRHLEHSEHRS